MSTKLQEITWKTHPEFQNETQGFFIDQEIFTIKNLSKNNNQFTLLSWGFKNETFNHSTSSKNLGIFLSIDQAKDFAEKKWQSFINELIIT